MKHGDAYSIGRDVKITHYITLCAFVKYTKDSSWVDIWGDSTQLMMARCLPSAIENDLNNNSFKREQNK